MFTAQGLSIRGYFLGESGKQIDSISRKDLFRRSTESGSTNHTSRRRARFYGKT